MLCPFAIRALPAPVLPSAAMRTSVSLVRSMMLGMRVFTLLFSASVLGGCTVGNWNICGPQTPRAHCGKNAYERLVNPVKPRDMWARQHTDASVLSHDWQACGGLPSGGISPDRLGATGLETVYLSRDKLYSAQRCMMDKGYEYTGTCEGEVPSRYPACQARSE